jgi:hypothetical protein
MNPHSTGLSLRTSQGCPIVQMTSQTKKSCIKDVQPGLHYNKYLEETKDHKRMFSECPARITLGQRNRRLKNMSLGCPAG